MGVSSIYVTSNDGKLSKLPFYASESRQYKIQLADIIRELNVVSDQQESDIYKQGITNVTIGSNVSAIGISCFAECHNLSAVAINPVKLDSFKRIEDYSFAGCSSLSSVSFLDESIKSHSNELAVIDYIGEKAFAGCGITAAYVPLRRSTGETYIGPSAFANCQSLLHAENVLFNYLGPYEFANCRNLSSVTMTDYHAYSYQCTFKDCVSLKHVTIPAAIWRLGDRTFQGCTSLTSITFTDTASNPSQLSLNGCYGNYFLSGTAVTSLTFPRSVKNWLPFSQNALGGMDKLKHIKFNGIPFSLLGKEHNEHTDEYDTHHLICDADIYEKLLALNTNGVSLAKCISKADDSLPEVFAEIAQQKQPIIFIKSNVGVCENCKIFEKNVLFTKRFVNWLKNENDKCVIMIGYNGIYVPNLYLNNGKVTGISYPIVYGVWSNGTSIRWFDGGDAYYATVTTPDEFISRIDRFTKGFTGTQTKVTYTVRNDILSSAVFGLRHTVTLESKEGKLLKVSKQMQSSGFSFDYQQEVVVDRRTSDSNFFKFGQWYYNAKQLKKLADKYHIPMFVELGSKGCGPCEDFAAQVFQDDDFQSFMADNKIFLCRTVSDTSGWPDSYGCGYVYDWIGKNGKPPYNNRGRMPIMLLHWNTLKSSKNIQTGQYVPAVKESFAWFNTTDKSSDKTFPSMNSTSQVIAWITSLSTEWNMSSAIQQSKDAGREISYFNKPTVTFEGCKKNKNKNLPHWYKHYAYNQDDLYGAYVPVKHLIDPRDSSDPYMTDDIAMMRRCVISVLNESNKLTQYTLDINNPNVGPFPPPAVYQYFTIPVPTASADMPTFQATYDISGMLFSIGNTTKTEDYSTKSYDYAEKKLVNFQNEQSLTGSEVKRGNIKRQFDWVYKYDSDGNPTTDVDFSQFSDGSPIYNSIVTYTLNKEKPSKVIAYLSGEVKVNSTTHELQYVHESDLDNNLYVISAVFYKNTTTDVKLQWLSAFRNDDIW